jgi:putative membrane protein insertion efficiency factor
MKAIMLVAVRFYRNWISPALPGSCRFSPTCSTYAQQALERHGAWQGTLLTVRRLLKCHPFHSGGYDPVPEKAILEYRGTEVSGTNPEPAN